ncbi:hypothetical protein CR513_40905, partial [Mucuna pruriens]
MDTWWVDSGATTHISVTMQSCLWSLSPSEDERFIFVGDSNKVETFVALSYRRNLISIFSLDKFGFSCSFGNNKVSLFQNSNVVGFGFLVDNLYMLDVRIQRLVLDEILECRIVPQYTMPDKPSMNGVSTKAVNKTLMKFGLEKSNIKHLHIWDCPVEARSYKLYERKLDSIIISCYFVGYAECSRGYKFYDPTSRSFFETGNARILEEVEFGKEESIRNIVFEEESVNDSGQVLVHITVQETTLVIRDNVQTIVLDIVLEQDYDEVLPQTPIERSIRERRHAIPDDYIVFLQEHEDDIGLTKDDPINFCQAMQSSNSKKWIDSMKDELKSIQDNGVWDLVELLEGVKPIGCKWIFKTKKDSKGNIEKYKARLVVKGFTQKEGIDYKEIFSWYLQRILLEL